MPSKSQRRRHVLVWHRRLGLASAAIVLVLCATGLLLNHTSYLGLDRRLIDADAVMAWYGLDPAADPISFEIGGRRVTWVDGTLYLDDEPLEAMLAELTGAVALDDGIALGSKTSVLVLRGDGTTVVELEFGDTPDVIRSVGVGEDRELVIRRTRSGDAATEDLAEWSPYGGAVRWSEARELPHDLRRRILEQYRGPGLPLSRVLLDVHSGRIAGKAGPYIVDLATICLVILAGTGFYNWLAGRRKRS